MIIIKPVQRCCPFVKPDFTFSLISMVYWFKKDNKFVQLLILASTFKTFKDL